MEEGSERKETTTREISEKEANNKRKRCEEEPSSPSFTTGREKRLKQERKKEQEEKEFEELAYIIEKKEQIHNNNNNISHENEQSTSTPPTPILPTDLWAKILLKLPVPELLPLRSVCPQWRKLINETLVEELTLTPHREKLTDATLLSILQQFPNLAVLSLKHCYVTDEALKALPSALTCLNLSWCSKITGEGLQYLPPSIKNINLSWTYVTDTSLSYLPSSLQVLKVGGAFHLGDAGMKDLLTRSTELLALQISGCPNITDEILPSLPPSLKELEAFACRKITEEALAQLPRSIHVFGRIWHDFDQILVVREKSLLE